MTRFVMKDKMGAFSKQTYEIQKLILAKNVDFYFGFEMNRFEPGTLA